MVLPDGKRHRRHGVRAIFDRRRMVGQDSHTHRLIPSGNLVEDRADTSLVEHLHTPFLQLRLPIVTRLVRSLHVQENKVFLAELLNSSIPFALIVSVPQTSDTGHLDFVQSAIDADAEDQVDGRNDGARLDAVGEELAQ